MPGPYPLPTLAAQVTANGISAPPFSDIYASLQATYQGIYGEDAYLEPDSQDGQLLASFAAAINDCNSSAIAVYNSFSPATAQGAGLSSNVKINGLERHAASNSQVDVTIGGTPGTQIVNGVVATDPEGDQWALPSEVDIPPGAVVTVTATAVASGAVAAAPGTVTKIVTPQFGWVSVTNGTAAIPGANVETDAELRQRQTVSTMLPAQTPMESIEAQVWNLPGVQDLKGYDNDTGQAMILPGLPDGIPAHTISLVVVGGDDVEIAQTIANGKLGTGTYGDTTVTLIDAYGMIDVINFDRPTPQALAVAMTLKPLPGYVATTGDAIRQALSSFVAGLAIGSVVYLYDMVVASHLLPGQPGYGTYKIEADQLTQGLLGDALGYADIQLLWDGNPGLDPANVTITVPV